MDLVPTPTGAAVEITGLLLPYIGMVLIVIIAFMIKDFTMKLSKGIAFSLNKQFEEGDHVLLDGERALIVKIGMTQTVFGITKKNGEFDGDHVWRYVPNERIEFLKLEKLIFNRAPVDNKEAILENRDSILNNAEDLKKIKELKDV